MWRMKSRSKPTVFEYCSVRALARSLNFPSRALGDVRLRAKCRRMLSVFVPTAQISYWHENTLLQQNIVAGGGGEYDQISILKFIGFWATGDPTCACICAPSNEVHHLEGGAELIRDRAIVDSA